MIKTDISSYQDLADAIILQAVKDYRALGKHLKLCPDLFGLQLEVMELEQFFLSDLFQTLSGGADGEKLLMRLRKETGL